jgi:hypothetical protein
MKTREDLQKTLYNRVLRSRPEIKFDIFEKCIEMKKLSRVQATNIENGSLSLDTLEIQQVFWIFKNSLPIINNIGLLEEYFTDNEIKNYEYYEITDNKTESYPINFNGAVILTPNESNPKQFGFYLSVKRLKNLYAAGLLQVIPELQRGGSRNIYDELKTKVNRRRVKEIADKISNGEFFYNSISFNLIDDDEAEWNYNDGKITITSGLLIVPDGNHRAFSCESISDTNPHINDMFHILFTVLTPSETRKKIDQEWNTEPVSASQKVYMSNNNSNMILNMVLRDEELDPLIKRHISISSEKKSTNQSAFLYSDVVSAIKKHYNGNDLGTRVEQKEVANWLVQFFNQIAYIYKDDLIDFTHVRKTKWHVSSCAMYGFINLSKQIQNKNEWKLIMSKVLENIDFSLVDVIRSERSKKYKEHIVEKLFSEAISHVNVQ